MTGTCKLHLVRSWCRESGSSLHLHTMAQLEMEFSGRTDRLLGNSEYSLFLFFILFFIFPLTEP